MLMSFIRFGKFLAVMSSNVFSVPFSFFSSSGTHIMHRLVYWLFSYKYFRLFIFFILFSFCSPDWIISIMYLKSFLILSSSHSHLLFISLMNFSFQLLYFSTPDFLFSFLKNNICLFIDILYLISFSLSGLL